MIEHLAKGLTLILMALGPTTAFAHHCGLYEYKATIVRVYEGSSPAGGEIVR